MTNDKLIETFFEKSRWITAIQIGLEKGIDKPLLRRISDPKYRIDLYHDIRDGKYTILPPHEAQIPKEDNTFRIVYVNENEDRILLSIYNDMIFDLCSDMIHPACKSYQKNIGCGKIVQSISRKIPKIKHNDIGVKVDLSKYFDSVPIEYIDRIFDQIDEKVGQSAITNVVKKYYHTNTIIDLNKNTIEKYSSLRQGCAFAAFLADAVLYHIDEEISKMNIHYVRYSDDILIIGNDWKKAYERLSQMLNDMHLTLNPKKVEFLQKDHWFKFLGFTIKNDQISLSASRIKTFQNEIEARTINNPTTDIQEVLHRVNQFLYIGDGEYSWATSVLPIMTVERDINTLNSFVMDSIRASVTNKKLIGGLGFKNNDPNSTIMRGHGKNVKANQKKIEVIDNYFTLKCMQSALLMSKEIYNALTLSMI